MVDFTAFSQGFSRRGQEMARERRELANAFDQFRANNPHATFSDYQSWIDQRVGKGQNYLRGGVPGTEVLQSYANENAQTKKRHDEQLRLADLTQQMQTDRAVRALANEHLLNSPDALTARDSFVNALGGDPETAQSLLGGTDLGKLFTEDTHNEAGQRWAFENHDRISRMVDQLDGNVGDINAFADRMNAPVAAVKPIVAAAKREAARREDALDRTRRGIAVQQRNSFMADPSIQSAIRSGNQDLSTKLMLDRAKYALTDNDFRAVYGVDKAQATGSIFSDIYEGTLNEQQAHQSAVNAQTLQQAQAASQQASSQFIANNKAQAASVIKTLYGNEGGAEGLTALLGGRYVFDQKTIEAFVTAYDEAGKKDRSSASAMASFIENHPAFKEATGGAPNLEGAVSAISDRTLNSAGGFKLQAYDEWHADELDIATSGFAEVDKDIDRQVDLYSSDPAILYERLEAIAHKIRQGQEIQRETFLRREQLAPQWVKYGTAFDPEAAFGDGTDSITTVTDQMARERLARIEQLKEEQIALIERRRQEQEAAAQQAREDGAKVRRDIYTGLAARGGR